MSNEPGTKPDDWLQDNPEALASVELGIEQSARGETQELPEMMKLIRRQLLLEKCCMWLVVICLSLALIYNVSQYYWGLTR